MSVKAVYGGSFFPSPSAPAPCVAILSSASISHTCSVYSVGWRSQ